MYIPLADFSPNDIPSELIVSEYTQWVASVLIPQTYKCKLDLTGI